MDSIYYLPFVFWYFSNINDINNYDKYIPVINNDLIKNWYLLLFLPLLQSQLNNHFISIMSFVTLFKYLNDENEFKDIVFSLYLSLTFIAIYTKVFTRKALILPILFSLVLLSLRKVKISNILLDSSLVSLLFIFNK